MRVMMGPAVMTVSPESRLAFDLTSEPSLFPTSEPSLFPTSDPSLLRLLQICLREEGEEKEETVDSLTPLCPL